MKAKKEIICHGWRKVYQNPKEYVLTLSEYDIAISLENMGKSQQTSGTVNVIAEDENTIKMFCCANRYNKYYISSIWKKVK
jgi:hypothetical protein